MNVIFLYFSFLGLILAFPQPPDIDDELSDLPFDTDNFPTLLDEPSLKEDVHEDEIFSRHLADEGSEQNLKTKNVVMDRGPPSIGLDLFDAKTVAENVLAYEGSGVGIDENEVEIENVIETTTEEAEPENITELAETLSYSSENSTSDEAVLSVSNSSILVDQNTSDVEVEMISGDDPPMETKVVVEAELNTETNKSETSEYDGNQNGFAGVIQSASESKGPCPVPKICGKNCFVYINEDGCQDCQCMWTSSACKTDKECSAENQYCDLGKCNCQPGYRQNMKKTGVCEIDPEFTLNKLQTSSSEERQLNLKDITKQINGVSRFKRENKPRRAERLEWPGVCDKNEHCPGNLVCIHGDCWNVPEKTGRRLPIPGRIPIVLSGSSEEFNRRTSIEEENIKHQPTSLVVTTTIQPQKGMTRFVSGDVARGMQKTTAMIPQNIWFPPTTTTVTPPTLIRSVEGKTKVVPPLSVDHFVMIETTVPTPTTTPRVKILVDDHKLEHLKERKQNFLGLEADSLDFDFTTISPSHVKKIHISTLEPPLSREKRKKKKLRTTTPFPTDASEVFEKDNLKEIDNVEFPISSRIGSGRARPKALSAQPTREELKDHKKLIDLFNAHSDDDNSSSDTDEPLTTQKAELLEDFDEPEQKQDIEVSLTTKDPFPTFSPIPILPIESNEKPGDKKPYVIVNRKFTTIAPLENIRGDMATEDPPETTPEPAPFEQHVAGLWYPMKKGDIPHLGIFGGELRRSPRKKIKTADDLRLYNEYTKANRLNRPIRVEMDNAREFVRNECQEDKHCGNLTICCTKKWCDRTDKCGTGKFCLPNCESTKLTFLPSSNNSEGIIDIMYD